jgi:serine/threonine-protein kinase
MSGTSSIPALHLVWVDREGNEELIAAPHDNYSNPMISPDGTRVALVSNSSEENNDIWIWDFMREGRTRLTFDEGNESIPIWTPDGKRVTFGSDREGAFSIYWLASDGAGDVELICKGADQGGIFPASWSADEKTLLIMSGLTDIDISAVSMDGGHEFEALLQTDYIETQPRISPDGRWIAYMSDESGQFEIYVRPFPDVDAKRIQVSTGGGREPKWSADGRELFYRNVDKIMVVSMRKEPEVSWETPKTLFRGAFDFARYDQDSMWDIHPDGNKFLMIKPAELLGYESASEPWYKIHIVLNWFEELKEGAPR